MIDGLFLRWIVTIMFAVAVALSVWSLTRRRLSWQAIVGHVLHIAMSVGMLVMAWPFGASWPTVAPMIFFIVAAVWFLVSLVLPGSGSRPDGCACGAVCTCGDHCGCVPSTSSVFGRSVAVYHAAMMGAMAWMYAVMNGAVLPGGTTTADTPTHTAGHHAGSMPGMDMGSSMPGMDMSHSSAPGYVTPVNWILAIGFAIAAAAWLYRYFVRRRDADRRGDALEFAGDLGQILMAGGMSIMLFSMV